ncbi:MAG: hypothetical protein U0556_09995 [Dehalococcoidia bacterium]
MLDVVFREDHNRTHAGPSAHKLHFGVTEERLARRWRQHVEQWHDRAAGLKQPLACPSCGAPNSRNAAVCEDCDGAMQGAAPFIAPVVRHRSAPSARRRGGVGVVGWIGIATVAGLALCCVGLAVAGMIGDALRSPAERTATVAARAASGSATASPTIAVAAATSTPGTPVPTPSVSSAPPVPSPTPSQLFITCNDGTQLVGTTAEGACQGRGGVRSASTQPPASATLQAAAPTITPPARQQSATPNPTSTPPPAATVGVAGRPATPPTSEQIEQIVRDQFGSRVRQVEFRRGVDTIGIVDFTYHSGTAWSEGTMVSGVAQDVVRVAPKLFGNQDVDQVIVRVLNDFTDVRGNTSESLAMRWILTREQAKDVNWPRFDARNLGRVFRLDYIHPALRDAWNDYAGGR